MRVRIRQHAEYTELWWVESKRWFSPWWVHRTSIHGDKAQERALVVAAALLRPNITEVK